MDEINDDCIEINESLLTCSFSILVAVIAVCGHVFLGVFYWLKTGTFPLKEKVKNTLTKLKEANHPEESEELTPIPQEEPHHDHGP
jgi:hypothetical protein